MKNNQSYLDVTPEIKLFYRDFPADHPSAPVVLCLHGITRNGDDFLPMIQALQSETNAPDCRFIVPDMRGRGLSDYDPNSENYNLETYVQDCWKLLSSLKIERCAVIGTSMGGLMSIVMHEQHPERLQGILLNDIGPIVPRQGLAYILTYLGKFMTEDSWNAALDTTRKRLGTEYPKLTDDEWVELTKRTYAQEDNGSWVQRYDKNIRIPVVAAFEQNIELDLWQAYANIDEPLLLLKGALSQLLPIELAQAMRQKNKHCEMAEIQDRGHVPLLDETEAISSIKAWLKKLTR